MTVIIVFTYEDHCKVVAHLQKLKYKYYTYTPIEAKPYTINIDGLSNTYDEEEVKTYLNDLAIDVKILKVTKTNRDRQNRQNARGGGTAVFVMETIESERIILNVTSIEHTAVKLKRLNGEILTVAALYHIPKEGLLSNDLDQLENLNAEGEVLMGADLYAKHTAWGGTEINTKRRRLHNWITNSPNIDIISTIEPSRITSTTSSYIDFFIASTSISTVQYFALNRMGLKTLDFSSDHKAVEVISRCNNFRNQSPKTFYDYSTMNCSKFNRTRNHLLANNPLPADRNITPVEIDEAIDHINVAFKQAMESSIKKVRIRNRGLMNLPSYILSFIQEKKTTEKNAGKNTGSGKSYYEDIVRNSVSLLSDRTPLTGFNSANTADGLMNSERLEVR
uniref:Endo/exonuclease/phosphatase domain-containing protein n=1 Tax=Glossina pallidipes TaxID=7398 RepID=A0A1A9Z2I1_GLOPL